MATTKNPDNLEMWEVRRAAFVAECENSLIPHKRLIDAAHEFWKITPKNGRSGLIGPTLRELHIRKSTFYGWVRERRIELGEIEDPGKVERPTRRPSNRSNPVVKVPLITDADVAELRELGYSNEDIANMTPQEAQDILDAACEDDSNDRSDNGENDEDENDNGAGTDGYEAHDEGGNEEEEIGNERDNESESGITGSDDRKAGDDTQSDENNETDDDHEIDTYSIRVRGSERRKVAEALLILRGEYPYGSDTEAFIKSLLKEAQRVRQRHNNGEERNRAA